MKFMQGSLWNRGFLGKSDTLNKAGKKKLDQVHLACRTLEWDL